MEWSPDSHWLAVSDNYLATESAILIFDMEQKDYPLIYQTPQSKLSQDSWDLIEWNIEKKQIRLKRNRRFSKDIYFETVTLSEKPIKPTLYKE